jgi:hypothetical protein
VSELLELKLLDDCDDMLLAELLLMLDDELSELDESDELEESLELLDDPLRLLLLELLDELLLDEPSQQRQPIVR